MSRIKKSHSSRRRRQTQKWIIAVAILLVIILVPTAAYFWYPAAPSNNAPNEPQGLKTLTNHYLTVMQNLNSTQNKTKIATQLDPAYNQTDLFTWEHSKLTFQQDPAGFFEDPIQILDGGKGICVQWSIVYVSACLALNYQSRLVVAVDTSSWSFIHTWAEDYVNGVWVHVDPSDSVWDNPSRYQSWDWGNGIGSNVKIYAFEDGAFQDVTSSYSAVN
jgi:hypothetical protein